MAEKKNVSKEVDQQTHKYIANGMSTKELLLEINQLLTEKKNLYRYFDHEEISKYDQIVDIYAFELINRDDLSAYNHTSKPH